MGLIQLTLLRKRPGAASPTSHPSEADRQQQQQQQHWAQLQESQQLHPSMLQATASGNQTLLAQGGIYWVLSILEGERNYIGHGQDLDCLCVQGTSFLIPSLPTKAITAAVKSYLCSLIAAGLRLFIPPSKSPWRWWYFFSWLQQGQDSWPKLHYSSYSNPFLPPSNSSWL